MSFHLSKRSLKNLEGVHPDLVAVVKKAIEITDEDFMVIEGLRTRERQKELFNSGKSKTMNSRHLTGHAVDLAWWKDGGIRWNTNNLQPYYDLDSVAQYDDGDYEGYQEIGTSMLAAGAFLGVPIRWGADWDSDGRHDDHKFLDWVHFELPRGFY